MSDALIWGDIGVGRAEVCVEFPVFRYHLDPIASGSVVPSTRVCECCGELRGFIYAGPVYAEEEYAESFCPWCVADGTASERFDAQFVDCEGIEGAAPAAAVEEICSRTPGYSSWNGERWPACCGDACAFVGPMGIAELRRLAPEAEGVLVTHVVHELGVSGSAAARLVESLRRDQSPTLMVFRCLVCRAPKFHVDFI